MVPGAPAGNAVPRWWLHGQPAAEYAASTMETRSGNTLGSATGRPDDRPLQLVVIDPELTRIVPLVTGTASSPSFAGESGGNIVSDGVRIGRARNTDVQLPDDRVSEQHAVIHLGPDGPEIEDLGSTNGTLVGNDLIRGRRVRLPFGESVRLGSCILLVRRAPPPPRQRRIWPHHYFVARVEEECMRAKEADAARVRPGFAVVRLRIPLAPDRIASEIAPLLTIGDLAASFGGDDYELLLIPSSLDEANRRARDILRKLGSTHARAGAAHFPADGRTSEELIGRTSERFHEAVPLSPAIIESAGTEMRDLYRLATRVAESQAESVLLLGETGCGKEVLARHIHLSSARASGPFLKVNCAALPANLLESELFGHERGAFTGAEKLKKGLFESATGGTLLLDEIGELPPSSQAALLRALQEREIQRLGSTSAIRVDVRVIAATNRDLADEVKARSFRPDLYYRLNAFPMRIPPLRDRRAEIAPLSAAFVAEVCRRENIPAMQIAAAALALLESYSWPGNVRELRNVIERSVILCASGVIEPEDLGLPADLEAVDVGSSSGDSESASTAIEDMPHAQAREVVVEALIRNGCVKMQAARQLGIRKQRLLELMDKLDLPRPRAAPK
jgi:DNA-binding NtrC family response regulator